MQKGVIYKATKLYSFINKNGTIEQDITQFDMKIKYPELNGYLSKLCNNKRKSTKGWSIITKK